MVIVITTVAVVMMGQPQSNVDDFGASDPLPSLALLGTPTPLPTPRAATTPSAEASPSKKPVKSPTPTSAVAEARAARAAR
jgi:hypothetical protein